MNLSIQLEKNKEDKINYDLIQTYNDPLLLDDELTKSLQDLNEIQKNLSLVFSKYKENNEIPEFFKNHKQLYNSYLDFGFPFVGEHWIPHFTISSLKVAKNHKIIRDFLLDQIDISFTVNTVSIWNIKGNQHQMIEEFILK